MMYMNKWLIFLLFTAASLPIQSQSTAFVFLGGLSIGTQKWDNNFDRELLFAPHGALSIESINNESDYASLLMQIGYHVKGSATRFIYTNPNTGVPGAAAVTERFEFRNFSLLLGAKQKFDWGADKNKKYYYFGGLRGDYTYSTNIDELPNAQANPAFYPFIGGVKRWIGGVSVGGGLEFMFADLVGVELRAALHPDLTLQYQQPPINNVINPWGPPGSTINISERRIRNTTLEFSIGLRLLRKVILVD
jgi:hypothetical protein